MKSKPLNQFTRRASSYRSQRGISYIQLGIGIAVIGLVSIFALVYGPRYLTKMKVQNEVSSWGDLKTSVVSYGSRVGLFTATNSTLVSLVNQNTFPSTMVSGTAAAPVVTNQWGGNMTVALGTIVVAGDSLNFTSSGIPATACAELGTSLDAVAASISINGTATKVNGSPSNSQTVGTSCGGAAGDNNVFIIGLAK